MKNRQPICGLITDFGDSDYFIGVLKGVIKTIHSRVDVIDICNGLPSYDISSASFALEQAYPFFPSGTVFLVVVDPGVGTSRRILLVEHEGRFFIAPDNGVLTPILLKEKNTPWSVNNKRFFLIEGGSTFEARDKMAPAAAYLAAGVEPGEMSSPISDPVVTPDYNPCLEKNGNGIRARVAYIDKFGNIITNVGKDFLFESLETSGFERFKMVPGEKEVNLFRDTYANGGDKPFMLIGSHGNLEIAMDRNSAATYLGAETGEKILLTFY